MTTRIEEHTVGELARLAGVSVRTLHHYDAIGLLRPARVASTGYRLYGREDLLRLQEILFLRELGLGLAEIGEVLAGGERLTRLRGHRSRLAAQARDTAAMLATLDRTIAEIEGADPMSASDLYAPFPPEKQTEYEDWLAETYGPDMAAAVERARAAQDSWPEGEMARRGEELREIEAELVGAMEAGQGGDALAPLLDRHRAWVAEMWGQPCDHAAYGGLAELYLAHPDFIARFEALAPGFSQWLTREMAAYSTAAAKAER